MTVTAQSHETNHLEHTNESEALKNMDYLKIKKAALVLRAINHKLRQLILKTIDEHKRITVTELYVKLRLEQSVASQHLAILRKADIVNTVREGKFIFYTINEKRIEEINKFVKELVG
ncbi:MAG TPA: metalloregulator ArsR/SmtB family transcription factor [Hanamia sp.]|jgi:ArsR family transcriptional regulator, virulence genes transcriptional regulator|nr:metalloregulator ArsR/SmtB family transcription factor [Hanamia sp.]